MPNNDDRIGGRRWYPPEMQRVPFPTDGFEDMADWRSEILNRVRDSTVRALYNNPETRSWLIAEEQADHPQSWAAITDDGQVTLEELTNIPDVMGEVARLSEAAVNDMLAAIDHD